MQVFAGGIQPLEETLGNGHGGPSHRLEALLLAHTISIDGGLALKVNCDRAEIWVRLRDSNSPRIASGESPR